MSKLFEPTAQESKKLNSIKEKFEELKGKIKKPETIKEREIQKKLLKRYFHIRNFIDKYHEYKTHYNLFGIPEIKEEIQSMIKNFKFYNKESPNPRSLYYYQQKKEKLIKEKEKNLSFKLSFD